jgi:iron complex outermembrane receptor protein
VRPSNRIVNTDLQPEAGWNYETGMRLSFLNNRIYFDAAIFRFDLQNAIVRRLDASDEEFFVNAGGTKQAGLEAELAAFIIPSKQVGIIRGLKFAQSFTHSKFKFVDYTVNGTSFSGNNLTGVPRNNIVNSINLYLPLTLNLYLQHTYVSSLPVNDANTAYADRYHLLQAKVMWTQKVRASNLNVFAGGDNLLNTNYSLGNDLNAIGSRFYNPAAIKSYYAGVSIKF